MAKFEFTADLQSGNAIIDAQHKALIETVNNLGEAIEQNKGLDAAAETIQFLSQYVSFHFAGEEQFMADNNFEGLEAHKAIHDEFKATVNKMYSDWMLGGRSNFALLEKIYADTADWLVNHIKGTDLAMIAEISK